MTHYLSAMHYISTRGGIAPVGFRDAVMMGMADDGGLLLPVDIPNVSDRLDEWRGLSYAELAVQVMLPFVDLSETELAGLVNRSYSTFTHPDVTPLVQVGGLHILELFHGPTLAFKDVALQFLGNLFEDTLSRSGRHLNILAATSGDTGSAAISGVRGKSRIRIFVLHPHGRTSPMQALQMTTVLDDNVYNLAVEGTFDDCQTIVKSLFADLDFKGRYELGSVNSINWARLLAQVVYYFYGVLQLQKRTGASQVRVAVPTGNFGDIFAGFVAARMGLPISRLVLATNENDILTRFFNTSDYSLGSVSPTLSPSMDIQIASNFERYLYYRVDEDPSALSAMMSAFSETGRLPVEPLSGTSESLIVAGAGNTQATLDTIRDTYADYNYLLDPHTAVGVTVARTQLNEDEPMLCLATAHPAKFSDAITQAVGEDIAHHPQLDALIGKTTRFEVLPALEEEVRTYVQSHATG